ncbi:MAG TPA: hypothetical protein VF144_21750, partial [Chitinophagaceae bacterium]
LRPLVTGGFLFYLLSICNFIHSRLRRAEGTPLEHTCAVSILFINKMKAPQKAGLSRTKPRPTGASGRATPKKSGQAPTKV